MSISKASGSGTFASLISDIASQVEHLLGDVLKTRGYDPKLAPVYAQMLVGMVASAGQWWLDERKPKLEDIFDSSYLPSAADRQFK